MRYNRHDYFRYQFKNHLPAVFRLQMGEGDQLSNVGQCELIDISTGGVKFFSFYDLPVRAEQLGLQLEFKIFQQPIIILGTIAWKKPANRGFEYGIEFMKEPQIDALIIEELKLYTQQERNSE